MPGRARTPGGAAGRAGIPPGSWGIRDGFLQDWERILSFFVILFMFFDMFVIDCLIVVSD